jgi:hypothetical protein
MSVRLDNTLILNYECLLHIYIQLYKCRFAHAVDHNPSGRHGRLMSGVHGPSSATQELNCSTVLVIHMCEAISTQPHRCVSIIKNDFNSNFGIPRRVMLRTSVRGVPKSTLNQFDVMDI